MIFSQSSRSWNLEIRRLRFSSVSWILRSMLMGQRIYKSYLKEPNIYYITSLDVLIPLAGLTSWAPYSRGFDLMFCCCPLEILNFWKWGVCFHFALSPTNFVAVLPVRWVIHRNRKSQSTALEVGVLTLLGELQPTQLQCLGQISSTICIVHVDAKVCPRMMPLNIYFIWQTHFLPSPSHQATF